MARDARAQAVEVMAEAMWVRTVPSWAQMDGPGRDAIRREAVRVLDALRAARVPCPTCSGTREVLVPYTGPLAEPQDGTYEPCDACDDGRGGPLVLLAPRRIAWAGLVGGELDATFEDLRPTDPHDYDVEEIVPMYVARPENEER